MCHIVGPKCWLYEPYIDLQVPEILVVLQVFVVDGGEAALVGDVTVRRYKCVSEGSFVNRGKHKHKHFNKTKEHNKPI